MSETKNQNIGVFDSGIGGLTVVKALLKHLPQETIVYFGDTARVPYGTKSAATVLKFAFQNTRFLLEQNIKLLIVACNTATALSLEALQKEFSLPIVGVIEPGVKVALAVSGKKRIGVIGTTATITSQAYEKLLHTHDGGAVVCEQACPLFVPLVEEGWLDKQVTELVAAEYLAGMKRTGIDTLILGCTHYPLLKGIIGKVMGSNVALIDSAEAVALESKRILEEKSMQKANGKGEAFYFVSDAPEKFIQVGQNIIAEKILQATQIDIERY